MEATDVLISGGGIAGLIAAAAFGVAGFGVVAVDPRSSVPGTDLRSTALLQPALDLMASAGLVADGAPLQTMRIMEASGPEGRPRLSRDFEASEIGERPFGRNVPNGRLRQACLDRIAALPRVSVRSGVGFEGLVTRDDQVSVRLTDGSRIGARLLIGADGRDSPVRAALGIGVRTTRYGQKALAFAVGHPVPHGAVSTEIYRSGGPFTLVPLEDRDGRPASSVVWMVDGAEALRLMALPDAAFEDAMSERSAWVLGPLRLASGRSVWPIVSRIADRMTGRRTALMAEAAHVMPPIGAQGLNTSLADLACLLDLARSDPEALGSDAMLDAYDRTRCPRVRARLASIDALNRVSMTGIPIAQDARLAGLAALHGMPALRRAVMRAGTGLSDRATVPA